MIIRRDSHVHSACFDEVNTAVEALTKRLVCFNAHVEGAMIVGREYVGAAAFEELNTAVEAMTDKPVLLRAHRVRELLGYQIPEGSVIYNTENVPGHIADPRALWPGLEIWDIGKANAARYGAVHVPVGWHPSMERFERAPVKDIDVVFTGSLNNRRLAILLTLREMGLNVVVVPHTAYGAERDSYIARAKLALNMQFYPDGMYPQLRVAHLVANKIPVLSERVDESWNFVPECTYEEIPDRAFELVKMGEADGEYRARVAYDAFRSMPMRLPS